MGARAAVSLCFARRRALSRASVWRGALARTRREREKRREGSTGADAAAFFLDARSIPPLPQPPFPSVRHHAALLSVELGRPPTVAAVASVVRRINYTNKEALMGALLVAGWDAVGGGQIYGVPIGGAMVPQQWATDGSGSTYIWGYLDSAWKPGMTRDEAVTLVTTALALAVSTDGSSGGMARLVTITRDGAARSAVAGDELPQFSGAIEAEAGGEGIVVV